MALEVVDGARALTRTGAFEEGWVELQDAASQAVVDALPQDTPEKILDFCAGGGGKTLALAARYPEARLFAHDADPRRMKDLPQRARRAGARVTLLDMPRDRFDLVLADAPCSGSGSWRRAPEGKWRLTQERLSELVRIQAQILDDCAVRVANGGVLAYATCSVLARENSRQIEAFLHRHHGWRREGERQFLPADGGDGFFVALLRAA
jgi:16S rRNA (cytosine967-C5)-methyltransferase